METPTATPTTPPATRTCRVIDAGLVPYRTAWEQQRRLAAERSAGAGPDTLLLLEHPPTITLGTRANQANLLVDPSTLAQRGVELVAVDRGGDVTYHAPGQLVGYPILKLGPLNLKVVDYIRRLEELIINVLVSYGIAAGRQPGLSGVWVEAGQAKIAAVGVKVSAAGITTHGFALNYALDLRGFAQIVPCGISDRAVTSLEQLLGKAPPRAQLTARIIETFGELFEFELDLEPSYGRVYSAE